MTIVEIQNHILRRQDYSPGNYYTLEPIRLIGECGIDDWKIRQLIQQMIRKNLIEMEYELDVTDSKLSAFRSTSNNLWRRGEHCQVKNRIQCLKNDRAGTRIK